MPFSILVVDDADNPVGEFPSQEVWSKGLPHRIVRIMLEDEAGRLLLQKRSPHVDTSPNRWDHSAAGHVDKGESYEAAAYRELQEELGLSDVRLEEAASYRTNDTLEGKKLNRFNKLYKGWLPGKALQVSNHEVTEVRWFDLAELKERIRNHPDQVTEGLVKVVQDYY